jgi:hypothetical protein
MKKFFFHNKVLIKFNQILLMWQNGTPRRFVEENRQKHGRIIRDDAGRLPACEKS